MLLSYAVILCVLGTHYLVRNLGYSVDDSFITYRYAYHLKEGFGLVFNVGEAYYGTTAAGYAVLLAVMSGVGTYFCKAFNIAENSIFDVPSVSIAISTIALIVIASMFPVIARAKSDWRQWLLSLFAAMFLFSSYSFNEVAGHETYTYLAAALVGIILISYFRAYMSGGVFLAVSVTFRPDAILFFGIVPVFDWISSGVTLGDYFRNRHVISFFTIYIMMLGLWFTYLAYHFGTPLPGTMAAKKAQVALGYWPLYTPTTLLKYLLTSIGITGLIVAVVGITNFVREAKVNIFSNPDTRSENFLAGTWLVFGLLSSAAYFSFNVTFWNWYGVPILFSILIVAFVGWVKLNRLVVFAPIWINAAEIRIKSIVGVLPLIILILLGINGAPKLMEWIKTRNINLHISSYSELVDFIHKDSPSGAVILMAEPGSFGYHLGPKYTVVDELGLISPGVAKALVKGDYLWARNKWNPKYLICSWKGNYSACHNNSQDDAYEFVGEFNRDFWTPYINSGAKLYRLKSTTD